VLLLLNKTILDHFRNPHNAGNLEDATAIVEVTNPVCGDTMRLSVRVDDARIIAARFKTQGCVASIAAGSVLTDLVAGRTLDEAGGITASHISDALGGLEQTTFHAAHLAADALTAVLKKISD